ncbi:MAG: response regulator transcription factor [Acidobacteriota bacterium]|nr:response regulator transcription factor [Acidobacteriota bacterium]
MTDTKARILLVDDHALFRDSVGRFLDRESGLQVVGGCATLSEARDFLMSHEVDLVLLDFDLGERDGADFMQMAENMSFHGKVLLVTAGVTDTNAAAMVKRGVAGVFLKHDPPAALVNAIREVLMGRVWLDQNRLRSIAGKEQEKPAVPTRKLTEREQMVLSGVFEGMANKQIADRLQVSESSVKATLQQLFHKTGVRNRSQLVRIALERYRDLI